MAIQVGSATHVGMKRQNNEDALLLRPDLGLFAVADGMGGHAAGEEASKLVTEAVAGFFAGAAAVPPVERMSQAVSDAAVKLYETNQQSEPPKDMGTTFVGLHVQGAQVVVGHVGDSRAYRLSDGALSKLTEDHTLLAQFLKSGRLKPSEVATFPYKNVVTRALGQDPKVKPDVAELTAQPGDLFLLCSDGLWGLLAEEMIQGVLQKATDLNRSCQQLIDLANALGGADNISCVLVRL
jgi:protein phosphatase